MSLPDDFHDGFAGVPETLATTAAAPAAAVAVEERAPEADAPGPAARPDLAGFVPAPRKGPVMGPEATGLPELERPELPDLGEGTGPVDARDLRLLAEVQVELAVELGHVKLPLRDLLSLAPGAVLELDRAADAPVDVLVNGCLVARGEVVVIDGQFGVRVTAVVER